MSQADDAMQAVLLLSEGQVVCMLQYQDCIRIVCSQADEALQAVLLTVGRLCCMLETSSSKLSRGAEELSRMALTLLLDTLSSEEMSGLPQVTACALHILASLGTSYGLQDCRCMLGSTSRHMFA